MKMLDFIKSYNTYKLTDEQYAKIYETVDTRTDRVELAFVNTEKVSISSEVIEYYDRELDDDITCMIFTVFEVIGEGCSLCEVYKMPYVTGVREGGTYRYNNADDLKHVAAYRCNTDEECRDFLNTIIKNFDFYISAC